MNNCAKLPVFAFSVTLGSLLILIGLAVAESHYLSPGAALPQWVVVLLKLLAVSNFLSFLTALPASYRGRCLGNSTVALSLFQLLHLTLILWVDQA